MILRAQTNFVEFLEQVLEVLKEVEIDKTECSTLLASIQKQQLVIPVVGNFSAGKSTLLNRFLGSSVLPTGITPETSLATELHYSTNERIGAFSNNDEKTESFELNEQSFEAIKDNAAKYSYLLEFDKGLSFILSKTNLRTPSQVGEISHYIQEQIQDHLDLTTRLIHSNKDNNTLLEVADKIA
ncbi:hypothetical protein HpDR96b_14290 [Helicobacter pylori]